MPVRAHHARRPSDTLTIDVDAYKGGVGIWGAVPPVFDTTTLPIDRGIHVHREEAGGTKVIDNAYRRVRLLFGELDIEVNELDAIYYMVSKVFGKSPNEVLCKHCGKSHLDKDWFSVHPHKNHLSAACGKNFTDDKVAVGNPAARVHLLKVPV